MFFYHASQAEQECAQMLPEPNNKFQRVFFSVFSQTPLL